MGGTFPSNCSFFSCDFVQYARISFGIDHISIWVLMITSISVQGQINPEHAELWRSLGDVTFTSSYERIAQVLEALAPGAVALLDPLYELESEEDDDDTGEAPPGFNLSDLALSDDRLQVLFTIECWYEDEFVALLRPLLSALPLRAWRLGGGRRSAGGGFLAEPAPGRGT